MTTMNTMNTVNTMPKRFHTRPGWIALGLLLAFAACGPEADPSQPSPSGSDPSVTGGEPAGLPPAGVERVGKIGRLVRSAQSACKHSASFDAPGKGSSLTISLQPGGGMELTHVEVIANCAAKIATRVDVTPPSAGASGSVVMVESISNPEVEANCTCTFDVSAAVAGLAPGNYQVSARSPEGKLTGPLPASIPVPPLFPSVQSQCHAGSNGTNGPSSSATLQTSFQGGNLAIQHLDVFANCANKLALSVSVAPPSGSQPGSIHVIDVVTNPGVSANCMCHFDVSTTLSGLAAGSYQLTALDLEGNPSGPVTVVIP